MRLWFHQPDQAFHHIEIAQVSLREATGGVSLEINGYMRRNDAATMTHAHDRKVPENLYMVANEGSAS